MKFLTFARICKELEGISGRLDRISFLSEALEECSLEDLPAFIQLLIGRPFPDWSQEKLGIGPNLLYDAVAYVTGKKKEDVIETINRIGDVGSAVEAMMAGKEQMSFFHDELTLLEVHTALITLAGSRGVRSQRDKTRMIQRLLSDASPLEGRYIAGILLEDMRIGVGEGTIRDAIALSTETDPLLIEHGIQVINDIGQVAILARTNRDALQKLTITLFHPVRMMLAKQGTIGGALTDFGSVIAENKYDGARFQFHTDGNAGRIYSRKLEDVTDALPDVVSLLQEAAAGHTVILDGEIVAVKEGRILPFQNVLKRFRRKHNISAARDEVELVPYLFDLLYLDGETLIDSPFIHRREKLETTIPRFVTPQKACTDKDTAELFYHEALGAGHEGIMLKNPRSLYTPGVRGKDWIKIKPEVDTLDLVVIGAQWGEGKRAHLYGSFLLACREDDRFLPVSRVATGFSDEHLVWLYNELNSSVIRTQGRDLFFEPRMVFEIGYAEIQESPGYETGYALRFPRFIRVREDKDIDEVNTRSDIQYRYLQQGRRDTNA